MAGSKSTYLSNKQLDHALGTLALAAPAQCYLALFTAVTGLDENSPSAEVSGGAYARKAVDFDAAAGGGTDNSADVNFPVATADWGTLTHWAVMDAEAEGNVLYWGDLTTAQAVLNGQGYRVQAGNVQVSET